MATIHQNQNTKQWQMISSHTKDGGNNYCSFNPSSADSIKKAAQYCGASKNQTKKVIAKFLGDTVAAFECE